MRRWSTCKLVPSPECIVSNLIAERDRRWHLAGRLGTAIARDQQLCQQACGISALDQIKARLRSLSVPTTADLVSRRDGQLDFLSTTALYLRRRMTGTSHTYLQSCAPP